MEGRTFANAVVAKSAILISKPLGGKHETLLVWFEPCKTDSGYFAFSTMWLD